MPPWSVGAAGWEALLLDSSLGAAMTGGALASGLVVRPTQSFNTLL